MKLTRVCCFQMSSLLRFPCRVESDIDIIGDLNIQIMDLNRQNRKLENDLCDAGSLLYKLINGKLGDEDKVLLQKVLDKYKKHRLEDLEYEVKTIFESAKEYLSKLKAKKQDEFTDEHFAFQIIELYEILKSYQQLVEIENIYDRNETGKLWNKYKKICDELKKLD